jgi:hypothetical protein
MAAMTMSKGEVRITQLKPAILLKGPVALWTIGTARTPAGVRAATLVNAGRG